MSELEIVSHYKEEITRLKTELKEANAEAAKYRTDRSGKLKTAEEQIAQLTAEVEKHRKENATLTKKFETLPTEQQGEIERLRGELRTRDHKAKFAELAKELQARDQAVDALWKLSDYQPEGDEVDVDKLRGVIETTLEKNPFLKSDGEAPRQVQPGPGGGKGPKASNPTGSFTMSYEQGRDPFFVRQHDKAIKEAARHDRLTIQPPTHNSYE